MLDTEELRSDILEKLHEWVDAMPDPNKPFVAFAGGGQALSPKQIVEHVEKRTDRGEKFVQTWFRLALNHIMESSLVRPREEGETARGVVTSTTHEAETAESNWREQDTGASASSRLERRTR